MGAHIAYAGLLKNLPAEFIMVDANEDLAMGQVLDLRDAIFFSKSKGVSFAKFGDESLQQADIFVITAGASQKPGETRMDLLEKNIRILNSINRSLGHISRSAIVIIVTNPVDVLTEIAHQVFHLPRGQVFGSGTILDSSRMRWRISEELGLHPKEVNGFVLGEHGDSQFVAWSGVNITGKRVTELINAEEMQEIGERTKKEAYEIINKKGSTYFGIGAAMTQILSAVVSDRKSILPVSTHLEGEFGLSGISLGVPAIIGKRGAEKIWELSLSPEELEQLKHSATQLKNLSEGVLERLFPD